MGLSAPAGKIGMRQGGRVRPNASACRADHRRFKSGPWLSHVTLKPKTTMSRVSHFLTYCISTSRYMLTLSDILVFYSRFPSELSSPTWI